LKLTNLLDI